MARIKVTIIDIACSNKLNREEKHKIVKQMKPGIKKLKVSKRILKKFKEKRKWK